MKKSILAYIIIYFFIFLFIYTGVVKLLELQTFKEQLISSPLFASWAGIIAWMLPIGELILAVALFIPALRLKALYATLVLMSLFTIYIISILFIGNQITCSCGGIIEELSPKQHIIFNSACVVLSAIAIAIQRKQVPSRQYTWITSSSAVGLLLLVGFILFNACTKPAKAKTGMEGRLLPTFDILLSDSTTKFSTANISTGSPFLVIGFSPYCTHCQAETRAILAHIDQLKNVSIYFVTFAPFSQMTQFYRAFHLNKYPNITIGAETTKEVFFNYFHVTIIPYTAVFDSQKRLKTAFIGEADITTLIQSLSN